MKFSSGIDILQKENQFLRTATKSLLLVSTALIGLFAIFYDKQPVVVERSSRGLEIIKQTEFLRTEDEIKTGINLMLKARFNTATFSPEIFLNTKQLLLREAEQKELKSRNMFQSIHMRNIKITKDEAVVDVDRLISVGEIRSALKAKLKISFEAVMPNELNPYGLLLSLADPIDTQKEERK